MSVQAANDAQASTGSHDDDSTTSSTSQPNKTTRFYKRLSVWLTLYDQKAYLKDKVESLQAAGPAANEPDFTNAVTERKTVDINELRAYAALQDWLQDNDPEGTFLALRDAAVETFGPLLDERTRLIKEVVRTLRELNDTATNSSGAPDPTYTARAAAHQQAKNEMSTDQRRPHPRNIGIVSRRARSNLFGTHHSQRWRRRTNTPSTHTSLTG